VSEHPEMSDPADGQILGLPPTVPADPAGEGPAAALGASTHLADLDRPSAPSTAVNQQERPMPGSTSPAFRRPARPGRPTPPAGLTPPAGQGQGIGPVTLTDLLPADFDAVALRHDVLAGLSARPKVLPPRWFYDTVGSELFEEITRLPEYYLTRAEREILAAQAPQIVESAGAAVLVELGSGSSEKTRLLLDALTAPRPGGADRPRYVALDVSEDALRGAAGHLRRAYPDLAVDLVRADFTTQLALLPAPGQRLVAFLGSTIGNFEPGPRAAFLAGLRGVLRPGEHLLLGTDLVKAETLLVPAYDDAAGVTAAFDLNLLQVLNQRLGGDFDPAAFEHRAVWDPGREWIEMRLRARRAMTVTLPEVGLAVRFAAGEEMRTEISAKFRPDGVRAELAAAGFDPAGWWTDARGWFALSLWRAA
jgi:L-histidine N-alpha-methyltransferase